MARRVDIDMCRYVCRCVCYAIRIPRLIVYYFIRYYNIYIYMSNKVCTISDINLNSNSRQNLNFARSQGGAGARTALLVGGDREAAPPIPALYSGV